MGDTPCGGAMTLRGGHCETSSRAVAAAATGGGDVSAPRGRTPPGAGGGVAACPGGPRSARMHAVDPAALQPARAAVGAARPRGNATARPAAAGSSTGWRRSCAGSPRAARRAVRAVRRAGARRRRSSSRGCPRGRPPGADVLAATLRLLRAEAPAALGVPGVDGARRPTVALDQLAAGFAPARALLRDWRAAAALGPGARAARPGVALDRVDLRPPWPTTPSAWPP